MNSALGQSLKALRRFKALEATPRLEKCELCGLIIASRHRHVIDPSERKLICVCDPCSLVFDENGITKLRRVPRDAVKLDELVMPDEQWEKLLIPINLAFFYKSSQAQRVVALYPSPAGVTESQLELESWAQLEKSNPRLGEMKEDVEGLLVNRLREARDFFIAPIDRCFELVGLVRKHWKGFSGGDHIQTELAQFFAALRAEARS